MKSMNCESISLHQLCLYIQGRRKQICIGQAASSAEYSSCAKRA